MSRAFQWFGTVKDGHAIGDHQYRVLNEFVLHCALHNGGPYLVIPKEHRSRAFSFHAALLVCDADKSTQEVILAIIEALKDGDVILKR